MPCSVQITAATPVTPGYDYASGGRLCTEPGQGPVIDADSIGHMLRAGYELHQADPTHSSCFCCGKVAGSMSNSHWLVAHCCFNLCVEKRALHMN